MHIFRISIDWGFAECARTCGRIVLYLGRSWGENLVDIPLAAAATVSFWLSRKKNIRWKLHEKESQLHHITQ